MRRRRLGSAILVGAVLGIGARVTEGAAQHDLMPAPQRLEWHEGRLAIDPRFSVAVRGPEEARLPAAVERFRARLAALTGVKIEHARDAARATLLLTVRSTGRPTQAVDEDESYRLTIDARQAAIDAGTPLGALHGLETLLALVASENGRHFLPAVAIEDAPRFPWRGLMIDACRHWQPVDVVKRTLDAMAAVKLNVLHWHLTEDQGFRVESRIFPRLHGQGSDGLYYTQDQVREVVSYARARGIRVVPEFDVPGHTTSWLVGHPELGSAPGPYEIVRKWGIFDNALDPSRDEVYAFLDRFLGEMAGLFPDAYMHIGGDEVTPRQWNSNPAILDYMYRHDLVTAGDLQAHFNARVNDILARHGKRMVGWDEILRPELPKNLVVQSWRGEAALARAAEMGYDAILSNGYYLDLLMPASAHYLNDPLPANRPLSADAARHVLGGEACMWSEIVSPETIDSRIWPRAAAVAERLWSPAEVRDVDDMYRRLEIESRRLDAAGVTHRSSYEPMLKRIAGDRPVEPLRVLADVVQPVTGYARSHLHVYTSATPLDRLVDAVRPESAVARRFSKDADAWLSAGGAREAAAPLRAALTAWRDNHAALEPILAASPTGAEARALSRNLSAAAIVALDALAAVETRQAPGGAWTQHAEATLDRAAKPSAELQIAVLPTIRLIVRAARRIEALAGTPPATWSAALREEIEKDARSDEDR